MMLGAETYENQIKYGKEIFMELQDIDCNGLSLEMFIMKCPWYAAVIGKLVLALRA